MVGDAVVVVWYGFIGLVLDFPSEWWFLVVCWVCNGGLVVFLYRLWVILVGSRVIVSW